MALDQTRNQTTTTTTTTTTTHNRATLCTHLDCGTAQLSASKYPAIATLMAIGAMYEFIALLANPGGG